MLKSLSMKTPRLLTLSEGDMKVTSILSCLVGNLFTFLKEENHIASVLDLLSLRLLDFIQAAISSTQTDNLFCNCSVSPRYRKNLEESSGAVGKFSKTGH